jgi:3-dehydroquinate dehydratase/shikimate dehydrogenase
VTYLCVPIFVRTLEQAKHDIAAAVEAGAELIELRIDATDDGGVLSNLLASKTLPVIVTCRAKFEGGLSSLDDSGRIDLLAGAADRGADYLDIELATIRRRGEIPSSLRKAKLILSSHDFSGRPDRIYNLLVEIDQAGCDVKKIAWTARSVRDNLEAFEILQKTNKPTIALCMGEAGVISRILAKKFGAFLTFAALDEKSATAPGQISIGTLKNLYRWDRINRHSKVFGVVAHPVGHSMSPAVHNAAFAAMNYDAVYLPFLVNPGYESFKAFMESFVPFVGLDLSGLSVTLPHKENALRYLQEKGAAVEELAARIGAVNTILIDRSGDPPKLSGINTDYAAILDSLTAAMGCERSDLSGIPIAVLGAGGTGRTAVAALAHCGAKVFIFNRTPSKGQALAEEFGATPLPLESLAQSDCRAYINTTSLGMHPHIEQSPFGEHTPKLDASRVVFDTIYNPMKTRLLEQAESAGAKIVGGVEMFVHQACAQFEAWTGLKAPADVMREVIENKLRKQ